MRKLAIKLGFIGSLAGSLAGLVELSVGIHILAWIGNKESPVVLGIITLLLSGLAFISVLSSRKLVNASNNRKLSIFLGVLLPSIICFTTVGRLWYLPGPILLLTSFLLAYSFWFGESKNISPKRFPSKYRLNHIIGGIASFIVLSSVGISFLKSQFGFFRTELLEEAELIRIEIFPMDIIRITNLANIGENSTSIEVSLVMIVFILLMLGGAIALIASLTQSRLFAGSGSVIVFIGLLIFLFNLPGMIAMAGYEINRLQDIAESVGPLWYTTAIGASLILISSLARFRLRGKTI